MTGSTLINRYCIVGISVIGLSYKNTSLDIRQKFAWSKDEVLDIQKQLRLEFNLSEIFIISTCNRTEIYWVGDPNVEDQIINFLIKLSRSVTYGLLTELFYCFKGQEALKHYFKVVSGLDSMVLGESQIVSQVKHFFFQSREHKLIGKVLHRLIDFGFTVSKQIRTETSLGKYPLSISSIVVKWLRGNCISPKEKILLIGAGDMIKSVTWHLLNQGFKSLHFSNRTTSKAIELSSEIVDSTFIDFNLLNEYIGNFNVIITCTSANQPFIKPEYFDAKQNYVLIDLAVPRDSEDSLQYLSNVQFLDIDAINTIIMQNNSKVMESLPNAEKILQKNLNEYNEWLHHQHSLQKICELQQKYHHKKNLYVQQALKALANNKDPVETVNLLANRLTKALLHEPILALRTKPINNLRYDMVHEDQLVD